VRSAFFLSKDLKALIGIGKRVVVAKDVQKRQEELPGRRGRRQMYFRK